jgi:CRP-like cAMP-binding protein
MLVLDVALLGLFTTSSNVVGAALGLYVPMPKKLLASILAFAAGSLIASLAIELGFEGAESLREHGLNLHVAWAEIAGGFAAGAILYYVASLFLEQKGAAIRYPSRFLEYARDRKRKELTERLGQLSKSSLLRHLPSEGIEPLLEKIQDRMATAGEIVIRHGDPGDSLYIVATGELEVLDDQNHGLAKLGPGETFGEMALLTGGPRTATVRANVDSLLLRLSKEDFDALIAHDPILARQVLRMSHERALTNLRRRDVNPNVWAKAARDSVDSVSRSEESKLLQEAKAGRGAGLAIVFGNILDTIPGCLVIGAKFTGFESLSLTLIIGMFLGGIPEAAASATMLQRAGFSNRVIFLIWSSVLVAGVVACVAGRLLIGAVSSEAVLAQAVAGGAILALVTHAMIPEALHKGGSGIVLPVVGGFLMALYLALLEVASGG